MRRLRWARRINFPSYETGIGQPPELNALIITVHAKPFGFELLLKLEETAVLPESRVQHQMEVRYPHTPTVCGEA